MKEIWKKTTASNSFEEVIAELAQCSIEKLTYPRHEEPEKIVNLLQVKEALEAAIASGKHITVIGDYDADGCAATAILFNLLRELGADVSIRIPKRMSEGYGLNPLIVEEVTGQYPSSLIITVDNGISANDAVALARSLGSSVIIIDHHLPGEELPNADIIVDPHIYGRGFVDYCGAGLAYSLASLFLKGKNEDLLNELLSLAAVATVADVVPLHGENRIIVRQGLENLNNGIGTAGLLQLIRMRNLKGITSETVGYQIAPAINAPGRLMDDGAKISAGVLASRKRLRPELISILWDRNNERKEIVATSLRRIERAVSPDDNVIVAFDVTLQEGICGILAGQLAEKHRRPSFVLTKAEDGNWKGSGRSIPSVNMKELLDDVNARCSALAGYGGHEGAAGLSVKLGEEETFLRVIKEAAPHTEAEKVIEYHLELPPSEIRKTLDDIARYEPYGAGCPKPKILWKGCRADGDDCFRFMGNANQHVKIRCRDFDILLFNKAIEYNEMGCPAELDVIGNISVNDYDGRHQIIADRFRAAE